MIPSWYAVEHAIITSCGAPEHITNDTSPSRNTTYPYTGLVGYPCTGTMCYGASPYTSRTVLLGHPLWSSRSPDIVI